MCSDKSEQQAVMPQDAKISIADDEAYWAQLASSGVAVWAFEASAAATDLQRRDDSRLCHLALELPQAMPANQAPNPWHQHTTSANSLTNIVCMLLQ
jgi:hypothetical protein